MTLNKEPPILVLTAREDVHVPYVQSHLPEPMIIVDPLATIDSRLSYVFNEQYSRVLYDGQDITNPRSVWFRKPRLTEYEKIPVTKQNLLYSRSALDMHRTALYSLFPDALWVSDYYAIQRAERKPAQLVVAGKLGFNIPKTLITSDANAAKDFLKRHETCAVKPLAYHSMLAEDGTPKPFFTRKIHHKDSVDFSGLHLAPAIFQQAIDVDIELRVTVVGNKVFTGAITTAGLDPNTRYLDYKLGYLESEANVIIKSYGLPKDITDKCLAHARAFNLPYCAIDLLLDKKGTFWFLENNPNGQWAFIERETNQPIGKAIAELLYRGKL